MARDADTNDAVEPAKERQTCPECGHENIPGAAFCSRCGHSLNGDAPPDNVIDVELSDSQATSTYQPVTSTVTPPMTSPWARPGALDTDPGQTSALPAPARTDTITPPPPMILASDAHGPRGFLLGVLALLLILAVLSAYVYVAWLGDSTRASIDGWLPWM